MKVNTFAILALFAIHGATLLANDVPRKLVAPDPLNLYQPAGNSFAPKFSADGNYIVFLSSSDHLMPNDANGASDVFLYRRESPSLQLISLTPSGDSGNGPSTFASVSSNGRYVLFVSEAEDLVENDRNGHSDVFVRDTETGITVLISASAVTGQSAAGDSFEPVMSANGATVVFTSSADGLVEGDDNGVTDVFRANWQTGELVWLSEPRLPFPAQDSGRPAISPDGTIVAFVSEGEHLAEDINGNFNSLFLLRSSDEQPVMVDVFPEFSSDLHGKAHGAVRFSADGQWLVYRASFDSTAAPNGAYRVRSSTAKGEFAGPDVTPHATLGRSPEFPWRDPLISSDGSVVVLEDVPDLQSDAPQSPAIYRISFTSGDAGPIADFEFARLEDMDESANTILFVSHGAEAEDKGQPAKLFAWRMSTGELRTLLQPRPASEGEDFPAADVSPDGRFIVFQSRRSPFFRGSLDRVPRILLYDWEEGSFVPILSETLLASPSRTPEGMTWISTTTPSPRSLTLATSAPGANGFDIVQRDLLDTRSELVTTIDNGSSPEAMSDATGRLVVFTSFASNLVEGDTNQASDVFLRDLNAGTTTLISARPDGTPASNGHSTEPAISPDARWIAFVSSAEELVPEASNGDRHLYLFERETGAMRRVTDGRFGRFPRGASLPVFSPDGRWLAYHERSSRYEWTVYDITTENRFRLIPSSADIIPDTLPSYTRPVFSADSRYAAFEFFDDLMPHIGIRNLESEEIRIIPGASHPGISADGRRIAYQFRRPPEPSQVMIVNRTTGQSDLISATADGAFGNSESFNPAISPNGRFVAFVSRATNIHPGATKGTGLVFVADTASNTMLLLSGGGASGASSTNPRFVSDTRVVFETFADLDEDDRNRTRDVYIADIGDSVPLFVKVTSLTDGEVTLIWRQRSRNQYTVEYTDNLEQGEWRQLEGQSSFQDGQIRVSDPGAPDHPRRFYRVVEH